MGLRVVLIEGGEGGGKTTAAKHLEAEYGFKYIKLPTPGSDYEKIIFSGIKDNYVLAAVASRDMEVRFEEFENNNAQYTGVVLDRGPLSTFSYQGTKEAAVALKAFGNKIVASITDVLILDVDPEIGLSREVKKNTFSEKDLHFHLNINRKMRQMGFYLEDIARDNRDIENINGQDRYFCGPLSYDAEKDPLKTALANLFTGVRNAHVIDVNNTTVEEGVKTCVKVLNL